MSRRGVRQRRVRITMPDQSGVDVTAMAASTIVIVGMLFFAVHLLPVLTTVLLAIVPPVLILWFIVMVLRGVIRGLLP